MLARIIKIKDDLVVIQDEYDEIYKVQKTELDFKYKLGDKIEMIQNGDEYFFLPADNAQSSKTVATKTAPKVETISRPEAKKKNNTSGWLSFFIIIALLGAVYSLIQFTTLRNIDSAICTVAGISITTCNQMNDLINFERIFGLIMSIWQAVTAIALITSTKRTWITNVYLLLAARIMINVIDIVWANRVIPSSLVTDSYQTAIIADVSAIAFSVIWLIYFACSKQVKERYKD